MTGLTRWVLAHMHRVFLGSIIFVLIGFPIEGGDWTAEARANAHAPTAVRDVQKRLAELKFLQPSQVDGKLGPRTRDAITAFQQWNGLAPDGIVGPQTLGKLRTAAVPRHGDNGPPRRIEIYRAKGVTLLIDNGSVKRAIHSSAGKRGYETPRGSYRIQRKVLKDWSRPYRTWMPYASISMPATRCTKAPCTPIPRPTAACACRRGTPRTSTDSRRSEPPSSCIEPRTGATRFHARSGGPVYGASRGSRTAPRPTS